jgi:hypothetical protein
MKGVILKTDDGIKLFGCLQCSNAERCFKYCNHNKSERRNMLQASKLSASATYLALSPKATKDWYKHRENFIEIEIPYKNE